MSADWISLNVILFFFIHSLLLVAVYVVHHTKFNFIFTFQCFYNNAVKWPFSKQTPYEEFSALFYFNWIYKQRNWWVGPPEELFSLPFFSYFMSLLMNFELDYFVHFFFLFFKYFISLYPTPFLSTFFSLLRLALIRP